MKKKLSLLIILAIVFSCSSDDSTETELQNEFPEDITIVDSQSVQSGEILTINGSGFSTSETYIVTFTENQVATITEITSSYLKVMVPQEATSGNITLTVNDQTETIGAVTINSPIAFELYSFKGDDETIPSVVPSIVNIDPETGNETTIANLPEYISDLAFNSNTNQIYGIGEDNKLYKINITEGTHTTVDLDNSSNIIYELITGNENNLYAFKGDDEIMSSVVLSIVNIDLETGNETTIANLPEYIGDLAFNSNTNQIYGIGEDNKLYKINITEGTHTTVNLDNSSNIIYELITGNENNLYAFKGDDEIMSSVVPSIVNIDPETGNETTIANLPEYISNLAFNSNTNQIYGIGEDNKLYKINIIEGTYTTVDLDNSSNIFYELITN